MFSGPEFGLIFGQWFSTLSGVSPNTPPSKLLNTRGQALSYRHQPGNPRLPAVLYLHGYASDMQATKAEYLAGFCAARDQPYLRFEYAGNGTSDGVFAEGTIGAWLDDALTMIDTVTKENFILVGSSMGGWIGLHCALARPERIKAFIGIAAAPDFTEEIWLNRLTDQQRAACLKQGFVTLPSSLGSPLELSNALLQEGRQHLLLDKPIPLDIPVTLLQGRQDAEVPWQTAFTLKDKIAPSVADVIIVEDGDHRLAREQDLDLLGETVSLMTNKLKA